jgi:hypothetical protein
MITIMKQILSFFKIYATSAKIRGNKSQGVAEPHSSYTYFRDSNGSWS